MQAVFQTLCSSEFTRLPEIGRGLILTVRKDVLRVVHDTLEFPQGKGFPDVATRALVKTLATNLPEMFECFHQSTTSRLIAFAL